MTDFVIYKDKEIDQAKIAKKFKRFGFQIMSFVPDKREDGFNIATITVNPDADRVALRQATHTLFSLGLYVELKDDNSIYVIADRVHMRPAGIATFLRKQGLSLSKSHTTRIRGFHSSLTGLSVTRGFLNNEVHVTFMGPEERSTIEKARTVLVQNGYVVTGEKGLTVHGYKV